MARMYPSVLDNTTKSFAEKRLFDFFSQGLDDAWVVFHNVKWIGADDYGRPRDGETDFVIAHPDQGVLVIEVKGGKIFFDEVTGHFISKDQKGRDHDIHDPFEQAMKCKKNLLGRLKKLNGWPRGRVTIGHAVIFPDMVVPETWNRSNAPRTIVVDTLDLADVEMKLRFIFAYYARLESSLVQPNIPLGKAGVQALVNVLYLSNDIRNPFLAEILVEDEKKIVHLTEQQYAFLSFIQNHTHAAISGCAGSGKTFLAIEKARQLAQYEQKKVLFTCYNQGLANYIGDFLGYNKVFDVFNFHQLCFYWARKAGLKIPSSQENSPDYFNQTLTNLLLDAINIVGAPYDAIIVDEGQDFRAEWWDILPFVLQYPDDDYFYVFYDDNQRVYFDRSPIPIKEKPFRLDINCRNTQHIAKVVEQFYKGSLPTKVQGPEGFPIRVIKCKNEHDSKDQLRRLLYNLLYEEKFSSDQVAVLSARGVQSSDTLKRRFGNVDLVDRVTLATNEIFATTIRRFKGLERDVVVLCEIDGRLSPEDIDMLMYVGTSRAKHHLIVLLGQDAPEKVKKDFLPFCNLS